MTIKGVQRTGLEQILRELGRIPDYQDEGERLYRRLRAGRNRAEIAADRERQVHPQRGRIRAALAGLAMLVAWWLPSGL